MTAVQEVQRPKNIGNAQVSYRQVAEVLTRATGFMSDYDFTLNPYQGCTFGCSYCYAAFFNHDPRRRTNWGNWVAVKENAPRVIATMRPGALNGKLIYMSSVTDPYQPAERQLGITRGILEAIAESGDTPKMVVQTRSPDVTRDADLFTQIIANGGKIQVNMTVTTDDDEVRRAFEPFCPSNQARIRAIAQIRERNIPAAITMTPLLLVKHPAEFAGQLLETGVRKFIAQPFHFNTGKFIAGTRDQAFKIMAEKLDRNPRDFKPAYLAHYRQVFQTLKERLPRLGEGKAGFKPPF